MLVKKEQLNPCEVELHIEVEAEKVAMAINKAYIDAGKTANIPGFRKGKAPRAILQQFIDVDRIKEHAADGLLQAAYLDALKEADVEPYAPADVNIVKYEIDEALTFTAKVPLAPKVELGDYKGIEVERKSTAVSAKDVDAEVDNLRKRHAEYPEISDRAAKEGDVVRIETKSDDNPEEEMKSSVAKIGENLPDFDNGLTGMNVGDEKVVDVKYTEDFINEELRGKTVPVRMKMLEIREEHLPELTDEWVKSVFGGPQEEGQEPSADAVTTVKEFKAKVKEAMLKAADEAADDDVRNQIVLKIVEGAKVDYPDVMAEESIDERVEEMVEGLKKRKLSLEDFLKYKGTTYEELREELKLESQHELKTRLVLREIVDNEKIKVEENDIEAEMQIMAESNHVPVEAIKAYVEKTDSIASIHNRIITKKVMDFLVQSSNIKSIGK